MPTALFFGSANGLGWAIALEAQKRLSNHHLYIIDLLPPPAPLGPHMTYLRCNVADTAQVAQLPKQLLDLGADISLIVNCAAIFADSGDALALTPAQLSLALSVNLIGACAIQHTFLPLLIANTKRRSRILHTSSLATLTSGTGEPYLCTKVALNTLVESTARSLQSQHPHVSAHILLPGVIRTDFAGNSSKVQSLLGFPRRPKASKTGAFVGSQGPAALQKLMALGLSPSAAAPAILDALFSPASPLFIRADNEPPIDVPRVLALRAQAIASNRLPKVEIPPVVLLSMGDSKL